MTWIQSVYVVVRNADEQFHLGLKMSSVCFYLQADGQVDSAAEGRADWSRVKAEVFEELREGVCERHPGPLLRHHDTGPNPGQIQTPSLDDRQERKPEKTEETDRSVVFDIFKVLTVGQLLQEIIVIDTFFTFPLSIFFISSCFLHPSYLLKSILCILPSVFSLCICF